MTKGQNGEMSERQGVGWAGVRWVRCQIGEVPVWRVSEGQDVRPATYQIGRMSDGQGVKLARCQIGKMSD